MDFESMWSQMFPGAGVGGFPGMETPGALTPEALAYSAQQAGIPPPPLPPPDPRRLAQAGGMPEGDVFSPGPYGGSPESNALLRPIGTPPVGASAGAGGAANLIKALQGVKPPAPPAVIPPPQHPLIAPVPKPMPHGGLQQLLMALAAQGLGHHRGGQNG